MACAIRHPVRHDQQSLAHLPRHGPHPRQHPLDTCSSTIRLQPGVATSRVLVTEAFRHRGLPSRVRVFSSRRNRRRLRVVPIRRIAQNSHDYDRWARLPNLGSLLMQMGVPYDSDEGRVIAGALTAITTVCYRVSADNRAREGPVPGFARMRRHAQGHEHAP